MASRGAGEDENARKRAVAVVLAVGAGVVGAIPTHARFGGDADGEQVCVPTRSITLFAAPKGQNKIGYGLSPGKPSIPGPAIEMTEGDCLEITLVNDTKKRLSLHPLTPWRATAAR